MRTSVSMPATLVRIMAEREAEDAETRRQAASVLTRGARAITRITRALEQPVRRAVDPFSHQVVVREDGRFMEVPDGRGGTEHALVRIRDNGDENTILGVRW